MPSAYKDPCPTWASKDAIQDATEKFVAKNGIAPRYSLQKIIDALGGKVDYKYYKSAKFDSESIRVEPDGTFTIYLATDTSPLRDRFTTAHELGHLLLHYPIVRKRFGEDFGMHATRFVDESSKELVRAEWEANWFAGTLLMPKDRFVTTYKKVAGDLGALAQEFEVTEAAAKVRAKSLDLLGD